MTLSAFKKKAEQIQPDFELRLRAYDDLRRRGLVVKTGFKYGSHFRVYDGSPDGHHSKYLVHAVHWDYRTIWPEISRAVRLAHGVKRTYSSPGSQEAGRLPQVEASASLT